MEPQIAEPPTPAPTPARVSAAPTAGSEARGALGEMIGRFRWNLALAAVLQAVAAAATAVPFISVAELAKVFLTSSGGSAAAAWLWGWIAVAARLGGVVASFASGIVSHLADVDFQLHVRRRVAARLGRAPLGWFTVRSAGSIKKSMSDDVSAMHELVAHAVLDLTSAVVVPLVSLGYLFSVNWVMALVVMLPLTIGLALYGRQVAALGAGIADYNRSISTMSAAAVEFMQGISVVKTFGQTGRAHSRFLDSVADFLGVLWRMSRGAMGTTAVAEVVMAPIASLVVVLSAGSIMASQGWIAPVDVIAFALLGLGLTAPIFGLWYASTAAVDARAASVRVRRLLDTEILEETTSPRRPAGKRIELDDVSFSYDGVHPALDGVSFALEPGTTTALVGRSGSGKTTVSKLLPRFWDPTAGRVLLGGVDLREIAWDDLYRHVSFVFQDVQLLRSSVADNIRLARPSASLAEVEAAARAAQIHERILELPRGYDSVFGDDALLSGGEAQRVSIARAFLADTPILVLDEATAFADPESEALIQDALSTLAAGRTLLVIAHRLSTIQNVDDIVVLDRGRIRERGTHAALLARNGLYSRLWADHQRSGSWHPSTSDRQAVDA